MAFQVDVAGMEELSKHQYLTEVVIERHLYEHTRAHLTWRWKEDNHYGERSTALLAGKALNCPVDVNWKDNDLTEALSCFHGYVENTAGQRDPVGSRLTLSCVSYSKRTDLVPRHRAFQATTLLDIAQQVAKTEPRFKLVTPGDLAKPIPLSLQYLETDFAYISRMCHAWSVPLAVVDRTGDVQLGARGTEASQPFPDVNFGWAEISFGGSLHTLPQAPSGGSGATALARQQASAHLAQLSRATADYMQAPERPDITSNVSNTKGHNDVSGYYLRLEGMILDFAPGQVVSFEGQQHLIHQTRIVGHPEQTTGTQEFWLQPLTQPLPPQKERPQWPSRSVWGHVTANEHDPLQQGRVQVEFEWEHLDPQPSGERAWLHLLTPYGGGHAPAGGSFEGRKAPAYSGFYSVPEVGERVLVDFLGDWDSEAVILGTMRHTSQKATFNPKHTKRWATPSGNEVTMHSRGADELVRIKNKGQTILEAHTDGGGHHVSILSGGSEEDSVHISVNKNGTKVEIRGSNDMLVYAKNNMHIKAGNHLLIEGNTVHVQAGDRMLLNAPNRLQTQAQQVVAIAPQHLQLQGGQVEVMGVTGEVHIDSAAHVRLNTQPLPAPAVFPPFPQEKSM